jgi:hypothetical protein
VLRLGTGRQKGSAGVTAARRALTSQNGLFPAGR